MPIDHLVMATLPATCTVGDLGYQTAGTTGLYACTSANTWTVNGGGGGSGTVTQVNTTGPITGGPITATGTIACATCGVTGSPLSQFAATTSAQLAGVVSDETGNGLLVFATSPVFTTPNLGTPSALVLTNATSLPIGAIANALITPAKLAASTFDTQTDGATVTWAIGSVLNAQATLTFTAHSGSRTLNITGPVTGGNYVLKLIQDATGGEGLTLGTGCTWKVGGGGSGAVALTSAASAIDVLTFIYDGTNCLATLIPNAN